MELESITSFFPLSILLLILVIWILPIIRLFESKFELWNIKGYFMVFYSLLFNGLILNELLGMDASTADSYFPIDVQNTQTVELVVTQSALFLIFVISLLFTGVMLYSIRYLKWESRLTDRGDYKLYFYVLMVVAFLGMQIVILANDAFTIFVGWEMMVIPGYALISMRPRKNSSEAGIKYALQSTIGSIFLLYGIVILYELSGTFNLTLMKAEFAAGDISSNILAWQAIVFMLIGFGVTAGFAGMQTWIPDAYGEAPSNVSAFIAGSFALAAVVGIFRLIIDLFDPTVFMYGDILLWAGIITMTLGNLGAIRQVDVRRFLGYSSIAQRGYLLFGLGIVAISAQNFADTMVAVYAQAIAYLFLEGILFIAMGNILYVYYQKLPTRDIRKLEGAASTKHLTALAIILAAFGLAGLPPTFGFVSKISIVVIASVGSINDVAFLLFIINSLISVFYYAVFIQKLVLKKPSDELKEAKTPVPLMMNLTTIILIVVCVAFSVKPDMWLSLI